MTTDNLSFGITLPYKQRCNLPDCTKATQRVYRVNVDDHGLSFCSNDHARVGLSRWEEKVKMGIRPGQKQSIDTHVDEQVGDNLIDVEGGD
jgi:hypothetical protein